MCFGVSRFIYFILHGNFHSLDHFYIRLSKKELTKQIYVYILDNILTIILIMKVPVDAKTENKSLMLKDADSLPRFCYL